ncbi:MAG TPA: hypothetical protein DDW54_04700 [Clostridiales bacterium]|nr:hypothetical protein [Clostridiales bacterium]
MHPYISELLKKNAGLTIDGKLAKIRDKYRERGVPTLLDESLNEMLLLLYLRRPKKILEFGTSLGMSGIAMLSLLKDAELYTIENREETRKEALKNFSDFGLSDRVKSYSGEATEVVKEVGDGFDFVFLDCGKSKYKELFPEIKKILNQNGVIFADNVLFRGYVTGEVKPPHRHNTITKNMREFLETIVSDKDFITTISDVGDGISVSVKK